MARGDADELRSFAPAPAMSPSTWSDGGETIELAGIGFRSYRRAGPHGRRRSPSPPTASPSSGDVLFAGSVGRTDFAGGDHATLIESIAAADARAAARDGGGFGPRPGHHARAELATNPFLAELRHERRFQAPRGTRDWYGEDAARAPRA